MTAGQFLPPLPPPEAAEAAPGLDAAGAPAPATAAGLAEMTEDGVGGGIMAVIMEAEDGEAISEATGVTEPEVGLSASPRVERELAALLRLKHPRLQNYKILSLNEG